MTTIWTDFDFGVVIRKKGHRKTEAIVAREQAPFEVPSVTSNDAPVALRFLGEHLPANARAIRFREDCLYAPLLDLDLQPLSLSGTLLSGARTELSDVPLQTLFVNASATCFRNDSLPHGSNVTSSDRASGYAARARAAADNLLDVDGILHRRVEEPMLAVLVEWPKGARAQPVVRIAYEPYRGALDHEVPPTKMPDRVIVAHVPLDRHDLASEIIKRVARELGFNGNDKPWCPQPAVRDGAVEVVDATLLRADSFRVSLDRSIGYLLGASHEALIGANDAFVLAWADMRESREGLKALHADAPELAHRSILDFLSNAPTPEQFRVRTARTRWEERTHPALRAQTIGLALVKLLRTAKVASHCRYESLAVADCHKPTLVS